jgi:outer membrane translocation and assembly module TamA
MPALLGQLEAIEVSNEEQGQQVAQGQEEVKAAQAGAKEVELRIAALDRAIGELKAQVREQQAAVDAKKEEADATVKVGAGGRGKGA